MMPPPTFLGIGAAKCGTTTLYEYLKLHPLVGMAPVKEVNWFGWNGDRWFNGLPLVHHEVHPGGITQAHYEALFPDALVRGEISPPYQFLLPNIARVYPGIPVLLCVRNPMARLVSHIRMACRWMPKALHLPFMREFATDDSLLLRCGLYRDTVREADALGLPLHVVDFADLQTDQAKAFSGVCNFLQIPDLYMPDAHLHAFGGAGHPDCDIPPELIQRAALLYRESNAFMLDRFGIELGVGNG